MRKKRERRLLNSRESQLAAKLRGERVTRYWTQATLSLQILHTTGIKIPQRRLSRIETSGNVGATELMAIADTYRLPLDHFKVHGNPKQPTQ